MGPDQVKYLLDLQKKEEKYITDRDNRIIDALSSRSSSSQLCDDSAHRRIDRIERKLDRIEDTIFHFHGNPTNNTNSSIVIAPKKSTINSSGTVITLTDSQFKELLDVIRNK